MKIITRAVAIKNLKRYIGQDLRKLALKHDITTYETGKQNKGWKGLVLERLAGLETNISKAPNGLTYDFIRNKLVKQGFEALTGKDGKWIQARTKGPGHGSVSRAFYARTSFVKKIFEIAS